MHKKDDVCFELFIITDETTFIPQDRQTYKTAVGIVMHDFHGLKTMTFQLVAYIAYF